ncbi:MAG: rRNA maturation RNase YbeY [Candidatus Shapirobacteria bacterium]|nr:rRNA maturation RNase YbeY [Candidatus Shapirobacteria bacterium]
MNNTILISHPRNWGVDEELVKKITNSVLIEKGYQSNVELSLLFVGKIRAKKLNIQHRQKTYIPQVLEFPMSKKADEDGMIRLGDIVICTQKLKYEIKFQKSDLKTILYQWLSHGIDNLNK